VLQDTSAASQEITAASMDTTVSVQVNAGSTATVARSQDVHARVSAVFQRATATPMVTSVSAEASANVAHHYRDADTDTFAASHVTLATD